MKILLSDHGTAKRFGPVYGVDIHHSDGGTVRTGFLLHPDERWTSHDEALAAGKQEVAYRAATSPTSHLSPDGTSYRSTYGRHECEVRVEVFRDDAGMGLVLSTPPELAWVGADGGEALLVGVLPDARRIVVVKRLFGAFAHENYGRNAVPGVTPYWTSVVESAPHSEKPMAYVDTRFWSVSIAQHVSRGKAVREALLQMDRDQQIGRLHRE